MQLAPSAAQPHWFCVHIIPQHSWLLKQFWPLGVHPAGPQTPPLHCCSQQSVFVVQLSPLGAQEGIPELLLPPAAPPAPAALPPAPPLPDPVLAEGMPLPDPVLAEDM